VQQSCFLEFISLPTIDMTEFKAMEFVPSSKTEDEPAKDPSQLSWYELKGIEPITPDTIEIGNTAGSTAGAGSGDFHQYRGYKRREMERLEKMEKQAKWEQANAEFARRKALHEDLDRKRTETKAQKRKRLKELRKMKRDKKKAKNELDQSSELKESHHKNGNDSDENEVVQQ